MKAITKPLRYVFYRILMWKMRNPRDHTPVLFAGLTTALLISINLMALEMVINGLAHRPMLPKAQGTVVAYLIVGVWFYAFARLAARWWVENGRFEQLVSEFSVKTGARKAARALLFWGYVVLTGLVPLSIALFWRQPG